MSSAEEKSPDEIEAEIEATRENLGDTVAELADRADLKKQARNKADDLKEKAAAKVDDLKAGVTGTPTETFEGTGGDAGSGPTGDVRNSPEMIESDHSQVIAATAAAAFFTGLLVGWALWK